MKSNNRINIKKGTLCKVDGGALLYTLFFILFISVLLYGLLFAFELYQQRQNTIQTKIRLQKHISLLEQISLYADKSQLPLITRQLNDWAPMDSQWIDSYPWGIYDLYSVNAKHQSKSNQSVFLVGHRKELEPTNPSLVIADQQNPLVLAGGTQIEGDIWMKDRYIQESSIRGLPFGKANQLKGIVQQRAIPFPVQEFLFSRMALLYEKCIVSNEIPSSHSFKEKPIASHYL